MSLLDDFREQAAASYEEEPESVEPAGKVRTPKKASRPFLGLTPLQRFVIALLLLIVTCLGSCLCLVATQRVVPPGLF